MPLLRAVLRRRLVTLVALLDTTAWINWHWWGDVTIIITGYAPGLCRYTATKKKGRASIGPTKPICQRGEGCVRASLCVGDGASQCSRAPKRQCMTIQRKRCTPGGVYPHWWHTNHKAPDTQINKHKNGCWSQPQNTIKTQHTNNLFVYTLRRVTRNVRIRSNSSSSACLYADPSKFTFFFRVHSTCVNCSRPAKNLSELALFTCNPNADAP